MTQFWMRELHRAPAGTSPSTWTNHLFCQHFRYSLKINQHFLCPLDWGCLKNDSFQHPRDQSGSASHCSTVQNFWGEERDAFLITWATFLYKLRLKKQILKKCLLNKIKNAAPPSQGILVSGPAVNDICYSPQATPRKAVAQNFFICIQNPHPAAAEHWNHPGEDRVPPSSFL